MTYLEVINEVIIILIFSTLLGFSEVCNDLEIISISGYVVSGIISALIIINIAVIIRYVIYEQIKVCYLKRRYKKLMMVRDETIAVMIDWIQKEERK